MFENILLFCDAVCLYIAYVICMYNICKGLSAKKIDRADRTYYLCKALLFYILARF